MELSKLDFCYGQEENPAVGSPFQVLPDQLQHGPPPFTQSFPSAYDGLSLNANGLWYFVNPIWMLLWIYWCSFACIHCLKHTCVYFSNVQTIQTCNLHFLSNSDDLCKHPNSTMAMPSGEVLSDQLQDYLNSISNTPDCSPVPYGVRSIFMYCDHFYHSYSFHLRCNML